MGAPVNQPAKSQLAMNATPSSERLFMAMRAQFAIATSEGQCGTLALTGVRRWGWLPNRVGVYPPGARLVWSAPQLLFCL